MAQDPPKSSGGNTPKPGGSQPTSPAGQSAKERSRAQSRPVSGKAATKPPPSKSTAKPKGGNTPRPGRSASSGKPPRGVSGALIAWGAVALVVVVVAVLVIVNVTSSSTKATGYTPTTPAPAAVVKDVTTVPASVYNTVGVTMPASAHAGLPITLSKQPALTLNGKTPAVLYFGAEYCPYCAAERWGIVTALARFGTWSGLELTASSSTDISPSTPTFSFRNATFTSPYLSFFPVENCTNIPDAANTSCSGYTTLQTPTAQEQAAITKYSSPTYIPGATAGSVSFPFMDVDNKVLFSGATYSPQLLAGLTQADIASHLTDATNSITQAVIGTANIVSASVCAGTHQQPAAVCTSQGVQAAAKALKLS